MQHVTGSTLKCLWPSLQPHQRRIILCKLRTVLDRMRSLPSPLPLVYGNIDGGPLPYFLFWTPTSQKEITGPFSSEAELYIGLVEKLRWIRNDDNQYPSRITWLRKHLPVSLTAHPPTFTHGDIQKKNIIVKSTTSEISSDEDFDLVLLDWENAGWYPNYFEYFVCFTGFGWEDDWPQLIETCLDPFPIEALMLMPLYTDIFL